MKSLQLLALLAAGSAAAPSAAASKRSYARWLTDSMISRGVDYDFHYDEATLFTTFENIYEWTGNETLYDFYHDHVDTIVADDGIITGYNYTFFSLDNYRFGNNILWWYQQTGEEKYKLAADAIKAMVDQHPRTPTGGFFHRKAVYPNQMWLDGIYMVDSFYAKYTALFQPDNQTAWDDITLQFDNIDARTRKENNLLVHGYDESKQAIWADPVTGAAPLVWGRAVGWYFMALLEVIHVMPKEHEGRARLIGYFQALADGLRDAQDERGGWWNVMEKRYEDVEGNYLEASASVMFSFGWLRGLSRGFLSQKEYGQLAKKTYRDMIDLFITYNDDDTINFEGTVEVGSLGSNATFEYYSSIKLRQNDLRGAGVFILAAMEYEKLC